MASTQHDTSAVMAGLVPAIHVFASVGRYDVDARGKRGHDEKECTAFPGCGAARSDAPLVRDRRSLEAF
jgi:hypothetical protein